jgi:hypothetical protein
MSRAGATRHNAKRDTAEGPIVDALRACGATIVRVSGAGVPDLLVHYKGCWTPLEIKTGKGQLTTAQLALRVQAWFPVVTTIEEALQAIGIE